MTRPSTLILKLAILHMPMRLRPCYPLLWLAHLSHRTECFLYFRVYLRTHYAFSDWATRRFFRTNEARNTRLQQRIIRSINKTQRLKRRYNDNPYAPGKYSLDSDYIDF